MKMLKWNKLRFVAAVSWARGDAGVNVPMCVAEGDGVLLPEFGGSKIELDGEEFEKLRETDLVAGTFVPDQVRVAIKGPLHSEKERYIDQHLAEIESLPKEEEKSTLFIWR